MDKNMREPVKGITIEAEVVPRVVDMCGAIPNTNTVDTKPDPKKLLEQYRNDPANVNAVQGIDMAMIEKLSRMTPAQLKKLGEKPIKRVKDDKQRAKAKAAKKSKKRNRR